MLNDEQIIQARHKLSAGRIIAIRTLPYFGTTLMAMVTVETPGLGKFTVDKRWRFYYDPEMCLKLSVQEIAAEWIHNVEHIVRKHDERFSALEGHNHDPQKYNAAADGAINSDLKEQGIIMPNPDQQFYAEPNPQFPMWKKNMSAEEMYFSAGGGVAGTISEEKNAGGQSNEDSEPNDSENSESKDSENSESGEKSETPSDEETKEQEDSQDSKNDTSGDDSQDESTKEDSKTPSADPKEDNANVNPSEDKEPSGDPSDDELEDYRNPSADADSDSGESDSGEKENDDSSEGGEGESEGKGENSPSDNEGEESSGQNSDGDETSSGLIPYDEEDPAGSENESDGNSNSSGEGNEGDDSGESDSGKPLPDCGSAAGGPPREYESNDEDDGSVDAVSADTLLKKTAEEIQAYANSNPGKVPGGLLREAKNILEPQIDWVDEFLSMFRAITTKHSGYSNYSYSRPSRRSSGSAFILPVLRNPPSPEVAVVLDTSGSMDESKEIAMALAEMEEILNRVTRFSESQSIKIINCDSASTEVAIVRDLDDFEIVGGGGTDMRVGIQAAAELKPRMNIIMTITDGFTPWPIDPPAENPYATYIALLVGSRTARRANPPEWMTVIEVKIPQKRFGLHM